MVRPLETLHNALSLRQLDAFLSFVTAANFKTPPTSEYVPTTPCSKHKSLSTSSASQNGEHGQQHLPQQSRYKRSIPPHSLGLSNSQDSSKYFLDSYLHIFINNSYVAILLCTKTDVSLHPLFKCKLLKFVIKRPSNLIM